ncbi:predicted membrane protein [Chthonomonas calidirosea]|uniref:DUF2231 domain-containing protein n=1 Tax=Chthonomonas calidirosea TaxID=454171 RepID=UPI0006DD3D14|nr:DUF2231 domain-containing protein [Chthonomonas calidirosea]CEK14775.1 predicted membrane protein [Chthonomonas calidirosea]
MEIARFIGFLHPALVHFPIVLLLFAVALDLIGFFQQNPNIARFAQLTLLLGTCATLFAFVAGNFAEIWAARDGVPQDPMEYHELMATITSWSFVFLAAARLFLGISTRRSAMAIYLIFAVACCALLGYTGHLGAMLVYHHAAAVQVPGIAPTPTHEDLAILLQHQTQSAIFYSDMMHHIFGWLVLILSLMLLIDLLSPEWGSQVRRLAPLLFLAGGVFLLIFSDQDSWPLYHVHPFRPLTDKEVLMHKIYAVLMIAMGLHGLLKRQQVAKIGKEPQHRLLAVFALVGGALLFTHVHSNAPYANVAAGVYIHHTVMGFVALLIGAVKLAEDHLQQKQKQSFPLTAPTRVTRSLAIAYPCLMMFEAFLLINYNEGLPWFLGYGHLSRSAPHHGLVAPLGHERAELTYNPGTQRFDLYLYHQSNDLPYPIKVYSAQLVIKIGGDTTALKLHPTNADLSHYTGVATFLHNVTFFEPRALLWPSDRPPTAAPLIADFEPWIDHNAAFPHSHLPYVCPMHPNVGATHPGFCPLCGMPLEPNKPPRPWGVLHDPGYTLDFAMLSSPSLPSSPQALLTSSKRPQAVSEDTIRANAEAGQLLLPTQHAQLNPISSPRPDQLVRLVFTPRYQGQILHNLATVHEKKMHLIVVSQDLSFFDHIHPQLQPNGTLLIDYAFPFAGNFLLFADITPFGDRNQVFRIPVHVVGSPPPPKPLLLTPAQAKVFGPYRVQMLMTPSHPSWRDETVLTYTIWKNGLPVTDLQPYLGAAGHCVVISQDTMGYCHSHPLEVGKKHYGPTVQFHVLLSKPGIYKIWTQFQHEGKILTTDFVIKVQ